MNFAQQQLHQSNQWRGIRGSRLNTYTVQIRFMWSLVEAG